MESALKISHIVQKNDQKTIRINRRIRWNSVGSNDLCQSVIKRFERSVSNSPKLQHEENATKLPERARFRRSITETEHHRIPTGYADSSLPAVRKSLESSSSQPCSPTNGQKSVLESWVKSMGYVFANKYNPKLNLRPGIFLSDAQIQTGISRLYGSGERRKLRPGERALIVAKMMEFIEEAKHNPEIVVSGTSSIILKVLESCHLQRLNRYTEVIREIEGLWRTAISKQNSNFLGSLPRKPAVTDPILEDLEESEEFMKRPTRPLSVRYRKQTKYIT